VGLGWVAQEREIFRSLSVEENLTVSARPGGGISRPWCSRAVNARHCYHAQVLMRAVATYGLEDFGERSSGNFARIRIVVDDF